jgi:anti-sigma regulatory factor (Ser/Thr protein kinase)
MSASVLLHSPDLLGARPLMRSLRAAGIEVALATSWTASIDLLRAGAIDLLVYDHRPGEPLDQVAAETDARAIPLVVVAASPEPTSALEMMRASGLLHLVAVSSAEQAPLRAIDRRDLVVTVAKLLRNEIFGVDKYLPAFAVELERLTVRSTAERESIVGRVSSYLEELDVGAPVAASLGLVADELAGNALRHAGGPVELAFGSDGARFAVAAIDGAGTLSPARIRDALDLSDQAAGMGLLAALHASSQLVFNLAPGRRTEVIALAELRPGDELARAGRSVHVFIDRPTADDLAIPQRSIELSESLRLDLRSELAVVAGRPRPNPDARPLPAPPRRRPKATPSPLTDLYRTNVGLDTMRGILRGAASPELAIESALRYLTTECAAAVAYRRDGETLVPLMAAGHIARWSELGRVEPWLRAPSTPAIVARDGSLRAFAQRRGLDRRIARLVGVSADAPAWALPISFGDRVACVLCAFAPLIDRVILIRILLELRGELEDALARIANPAAAPPPPRRRRAGTEPYAELELLFGHAPSESAYAELELIY